MTIEVKVPVLPESVADALLLDWTKQVGDTVARDEILVEVETDKVVLEVPAPRAGVLTEILVPAGTTVLAEQLVAKIEPAEQVSDNAPATEVTEPEKGHTVDEPLSPAVRRMVEELGIDVSKMQGTGLNRRITKEDVLAFVDGAATTNEKTETQPESTAPVSEPAAAQLASPSGSREVSREPMSRLRQTIASRLVQSQQTAALLTTFNEVNMQPVMDLRSKYKEKFEETHGARLGFMSFFVKASAVALQRFPLVNAYIENDHVVRHHYVDISIAVSSPRGLVVPVLRNCEQLNYAEIENQIREFGKRAQAGKITMDELVGGTFTITNGGVFGSLISTPIVNPPQSGILGMHKIQERPMAENGQVVIRPMMYLALSYDHRIVDGKEAVQFLVTIKDLLEDPARVLLGC